MNKAKEDKRDPEEVNIFSVCNTRGRYFLDKSNIKRLFITCMFPAFHL